MTQRVVRCSGCQRKYDVSKRRPGTSFRCKCGVTNTIPEEQSRETANVRCSGCGAAREEGATACGYCGADFTLHECDLNAVCPNCLTRVSSSGRFCHHCGSLTAANSSVNEAHEIGCPACGPQRLLAPRQLPGIELNVLECQVCAGLWLDISTLHDMLQEESRRPAGYVATHRKAEPVTKVVYRKCAHCQQTMVRRNFGRSSVIVDICGQHGIWFDHEELAQLLAWIRAGGLQAAQQEASRLLGSPDRMRRKIAADEDFPPERERKAYLELLADERIRDPQPYHDRLNGDLFQAAALAALRLAEVWFRGR